VSEPEPTHRALVARAIDDIQGSIHANDSKSSAGLITHGLLATAVLTLASRIGGPGYQHGTTAAQVLIKVALIGALVFAVASIFFLIKAVRPYEPDDVGKRLARHSVGVFFPDIRKMTKSARNSGLDELEQLRANVAMLADPQKLDDEYLVELLKVADIRANEADSAKIGFLLLGVEVFFAALYLSVVGCIAGNILGARATQSSPSVRWEVAQVGGQTIVVGGGSLRLGPRVGIHVRLAAQDPTGLRSLQLASVTRYQCPRHTRIHEPNIRAPTQEVTVEGANSVSLVETPDFRIRECSGKRHAKAGITTRLSASAVNKGGTVTGGLLTLYGHP
jgi:membrane protein implicated in regulation of membrane protease activity